MWRLKHFTRAKNSTIIEEVKMSEIQQECVKCLKREFMILKNSSDKTWAKFYKFLTLYLNI